MGLDINNLIITVTKEESNNNDLLNLIDELSITLKVVTGSSGKQSFSIEEINNPRALFAVARNQNGKAVGCGAIRPINDNIAEVKRMYAKINRLGIGTKILNFLETKALSLDYTELWLETRIVNKLAISFYQNNGYKQIPNYGKYDGNNNAICFGKKLIQGDDS